MNLITCKPIVQIIEERTGTKIACLEEIGFNNDWISMEDIRINNKDFVSGSYYNYIKEISSNEDQ